MLLAMTTPETNVFLMLIEKGDLKKIEQALEAEPFLANVGNTDESALSKALSLDRVDIARLLVTFGADPDVFVRKDGVATPALWSVRSRAAFDWMRKSGASLKFVGAHGESIYSLAFEMPTEDFVHVVKVAQKDGIPLDFSLNGLLPLEKIAIRASRFASVSGSVAQQYRMDFEALWNALEAKGLLDGNTNKHGEQAALYRFVIMNARHQRLDCVEWAIQKGLRIDNRVLDGDRGAKDPVRTNSTEVMGFDHQGLFEALLPVMKPLDRVSLGVLAQSHENVNCTFLKRLEESGLVDFTILAKDKRMAIAQHAILKSRSLEDIEWTRDRLCPLIDLSLAALVDEVVESRWLFKNIDVDNRIEAAKLFMIALENEDTFSSKWLEAGRLKGVMAHRQAVFPMDKNSSEWLDRLANLHRNLQMSVMRDHIERPETIEKMAIDAIHEGYAMPCAEARASLDAALLSRLEAARLAWQAQQSSPSSESSVHHRIRRSSGI